jgi:hypothetical protein
MNHLPDTSLYFFRHQNKKGYVLALQKGLHSFYVVISHRDKVLCHFKVSPVRTQINRLYGILYKWLACNTRDIKEKCEKLNGDYRNPAYFMMRLESLPQEDVEIEVPDFQKRDYEQFKEKYLTEEE